MISVILRRKLSKGRLSNRKPFLHLHGKTINRARKGGKWEQMSFLQTLAFALILTILMEYAVYLFLIRNDPMNLFLYSFLINAFTNPLFNYIYNYELHMLYTLEIAVAIVESILIFFLMELSYPKAILISLVANIASFLLGLVVFG